VFLGEAQFSDRGKVLEKKERKSKIGTRRKENRPRAKKHRCTM